MGKPDREIGIYAVFAYLQLRVEESEFYKSPAVSVSWWNKGLWRVVIGRCASCALQPQVTSGAVPYHN